MNFRNISAWCIRNPVQGVTIVAGLSGQEAVVLSAGPFLTPGQKYTSTRPRAQ